MMAKTEWTLLIPSNSRHAITQELYQRLSDLDLRKKSPMAVTSSPEIYPAPPSSLVLIPRDHDFWCTERISFHGNRYTDWDECLWQLALEMQGKSEVVKMPLTTELGAESLHSKLEVCQIHGAVAKI